MTLRNAFANLSTEAKQDTANQLLTNIKDALSTEAGFLDGVEGLLNGGNNSLSQILAALLSAAASPVVGSRAHAVTDDGSPPVKMGARALAGSVTLNDGDRTDLITDLRGHLASSLYAGSSNSQIGGGTTGRSMSAATNRLAVYSVNAQWNGASYDHEVKPYLNARLLSAAASDNATLISNSSCDLFRIQLTMKRSTSLFIRLYDKATLPAAGDIAKHTIEVLSSHGNAPIDFSRFYFNSGLGLRVTAGLGDADTTALAAGDFTGFNLSYGK